MSRYEKDFEGMSGGFVNPRGLDPNYRDGYLGMRMVGNGRQAAYGAHRLVREGDLETAGGFDGIHEREGGRRAQRTAIQSLHDGGIRDHLSDDYLTDFDSRRIRFSRDVQGTETDREPSFSPERSYRREYTERGTPPGGYSEGWARGPMRGSR